MLQGAKHANPSLALLHHEVAPRAGSREPARSTLFEAAFRFSRVEMSASWTRLAGRRILAVRGRGPRHSEGVLIALRGCTTGELPVRLQLGTSFSEIWAHRRGALPKGSATRASEIARLPPASAGWQHCRAAFAAGWRYPPASWAHPCHLQLVQSTLSLRLAC